ncbi:hypothetical protein LTR70_000323 [Exophiala xenobiotica]|uniref:Uncharacterized protein n=1 Tax=Lithohypha guttulata TaxID=1690604 RepID=A0ABR0KRF8_9EURO|nr:hypothetical protein LTR24_000026 [Lithohypha guttulata]KAK5330493.1 hypothetical protein LTR70_000323 [Exophiala xenobiotica]
MTTAKLLKFAFAALPVVTLAAPAASNPGVTSSLSPRAVIQDCEAGGDYAGTYTDGSGTYTVSDSVRRGIGWKCWNDYYAVNQKTYMAPWVKSTGEIYCTDTSTCSAGLVNGTQYCLTKSTQISASISLAIAEFFTGGLSITSSWDEQNCYSGSIATTCTWDDDACHTVWTQQELVEQVGYKRLRCNRGDGDQTEYH